MIRNYMAIIYLGENKENISPLTKVRAFGIYSCWRLI